MSEITKQNTKAEILDAYTALLEKVGAAENDAEDSITQAAVAYIEAEERVVNYTDRVEADRCYAALKAAIAKG